MAFLLSPGVQVNEKDLTNVVPAVATSIGATAGAFKWGPADTAITVANEGALLTSFGKPDATFAVSFLTAASFLNYGNTLKVARSVGATTYNAYATYPATTTSTTFTASSTVASGGTIVTASASTIIQQQLQVGSILSATGLSTSTTTITSISFSTTSLATITFTPATTASIATTISFTATNLATVIWGGAGTTTSTGTIRIKNPDQFNAAYPVATSVVTPFVARFPGKLGNSLFVTVVNSSTNGTIATDATGAGVPGSSYVVNSTSTITLGAGFDYKPTTADEIHILVQDDALGTITGTPYTVLERWQGLSLYSNSKRIDGTGNYYFDYVNRNSSWIYTLGLQTPLAAWGYNAIDGLTSGMAITGGTANPALVFDMGYGPANSVGTDTLPTTGEVSSTLDTVFMDAATIDINLLFACDPDCATNGSGSGYGSLSTAEQKVQSIANTRKDTVGFISAPVQIWALSASSNKYSAVTAKFKDQSASRDSYSVFDTGPLYVYNKYQDSYVWIPACGHMAGLCANTDNVADAWFSPAGYNRGNLKNVTKLGYNPNQTDRDGLYQASINPIVSFPGQGILLFGDKTAQSKPSAFDRINVRRLFIVLEKAIATAAKYQLFELNDRFTQSMFRNMTEPFLRDIAGRRGITDFLVVCDGTNNTPEVVDTNRFVADIYIKPARSINFITLNFIATRTGVSFSEVAGA
jgi:hypothetical protein